MVPAILNEIGQWLDRFDVALGHWEATLLELQTAYLQSDDQAMLALCTVGDRVQAEIAECKSERLLILERAAERGHVASNFRDLSQMLDGVWPALWSQRLRNMELQLNRIHRLSAGLWVSTFYSKSLVSDVLKLLATGQTTDATYNESETSSLEGGFLINEAA